MPALWLVMAHDDSWVNALPPAWWQRWAWYILRELRHGLSSEPDEPKVKLLSKVHERAQSAVRAGVERLATTVVSEDNNSLRGVLYLLQAIRDEDLDGRLCELLAAGTVPESQAGNVAQFVLSRSDNVGLTACLSFIQPKATERAESLAIQSAVALLQERTSESWESVIELLKRRPDLASRVLMEFANEGRLLRRNGEPSPLARLHFSQIGQLLAVMFEVFPPENDPKYEGAHMVGPRDSAIEMRNNLVNWLSDQRDLDTVDALRSLERRFGAKYPWLRHPRARAERSYRLSNWTPIPTLSVAQLLEARSKRLIRSERDALDGIVAASEQFDSQLHHGSPALIERLWNRPKKGRPTPKDEEHVSDELCMTIRDYFREYAVTADREVQIFRRKVPREVGGVPGSKVDLLYRAPAAGSVVGDAIVVPIEVKLAHNPEARTGLKDQLVDRYMGQLGAASGVYAVAYMGVPKPAAGYKQLWPTPAAAQAYLEEQAREVRWTLKAGQAAGRF